MMVFHSAAVPPQHLYAFEDLGVVGYDHSAVAEAAQVLAGKETQTAGVAKRADLLSFIGGTDRLGAVFDDVQAVPPSDHHDWVHIAGLAVEVDRQDGLGAWRDGRFDQSRI